MEIDALVTSAYGADVASGDMDKILGGDIQNFQPGTILEGRVVGKAGDDVVIEVGLKSEGLVNKGEFDNFDDIETGGHLPRIGAEVWQRALQHNGLWPKAAEELLSVLPATQRELPWVIATIGELAASGLIGKDLLPLSKIVEHMRGTVQTSTYIERLGPFFIGKAIYQSPA